MVVEALPLIIPCALQDMGIRSILDPMVLYAGQSHICKTTSVVDRKKLCSYEFDLSCLHHLLHLFFIDRLLLKIGWYDSVFGKHFCIPRKLKGKAFSR